jgi:hypothetical protein
MSNARVSAFAACSGTKTAVRLLLANLLDGGSLASRAFEVSLFVSAFWLSCSSIALVDDNDEFKRMEG